ncbi:MAG TPA: nucleotidyltransferase domain-containing protein [Planktothrix sp.]
MSVAAKHGAMDVQLFGSVARGQETEKSDLDFLVNFKDHLRSGGLLPLNNRCLAIRAGADEFDFRRRGRAY